MNATSDWPKCEQQGCTDDATARVFWPGRKPLLSCTIHTIKAQQLGQIMGCYIHAERLSLGDFSKGVELEPYE